MLGGFIMGKGLKAANVGILLCDSAYLTLKVMDKLFYDDGISVSGYFMDDSRVDRGESDDRLYVVACTDDFDGSKKVVEELKEQGVASYIKIAVTEKPNMFFKIEGDTDLVGIISWCDEDTAISEIKDLLFLYGAII